jgi:photosystem II stability/assembly factor-like uncharacterized protein
MKRLAALVALSTLLVACGRATPSPAATPGPGLDVPTTTPPRAEPQDEAATATVEVAPTPPSPSSPLPRLIATFTLGEEPSVCAGSALAVDPATGHLHTAGLRDGQACLTVIDPVTGEVQESRVLPFQPRVLRWDGGTLYAIGRESGALVVADAGTGQVVAWEFVDEDLDYQPETQVVVRDGWAYIGLPDDPTMGLSSALYVVPLRGGAARILPDVRAFDVADDGRFAIARGQATTTMQVYASADGDLLAEREIGPGEPGVSLAFDGPRDRIFLTRRQPETDSTPARTLVDVLDATSLEPVNLVEEQTWGLSADPRLGRVYAHAPEGRIVGFDAASGQLLGTLFSIPQPAQGSFTTQLASRLHIDPNTGCVTTVYQDFDLGTWVACFDPTTGVGVADVQVPSGAVWAQDTARGRLYVASRDFLLGLDATTLQPMWRLALSRAPASAAVAPDQGILLVGDAGGDVHVLDLQSHDEVGLLPGVGSYLDVDLAHGWLYAGDEFAAGVSVYDLATLEWRGTIPQPGRPTASPADGRVYILEENVYTGDGATLATIDGRSGRNAGCNGCTAPTSVVVDPRSGLSHTTTYGTWVGKPGPTSHVDVDPLTGHAVVARSTGGYRVVYTLAAYADLTMEQLLAWRDGMYGQPLYNPATGHLYLSDGSRLLVLEGETLDLIGWLYPSEEALVPATVDVRSGRTYLLAGRQVLVLEGSGGEFETPPPQLAARLPGAPGGIVPLPGGTLFVRAYDRESYSSRLYRSTDRGQTWEELHGGLPGAPNDLAFTPDGTLYAAIVPAAWHVETEEASWGEGVYRSDDGGDTWVPFSQGLAHLRVSRIHAGADGNVTLLAAGTWPEQPSWPVPTIWRLGGDGRWAQVEVAEAGPALSPDGSVPYTYTQTIDVTWHSLTGRDVLYRSWGSDLQRSADGGLTWETISTGPVDYGVSVFTGLGDPPAIYWLTWDTLYRSTDGGVSWARLSHPALADDAPSTVAVGEWDGEEVLFIGTETGELLTLAAAEVDWRTEGAPGSDS